MPEHFQTVMKLRAVTISREYGSGGRELAVQLAQRLDWQVIDHALVERVAQTLGASQAEVEAHDEHAEGLLVRILNNLQYIDPGFPPAVPLGAALSEEAYRAAVARVVRAAAARGQVVIVGRGAQVLLAEQSNVLRVRIIAPLEQRIASVMDHEGVEQPEAAARVQMKDQERRKYLESSYQRDPGDAQLYDLVLNLAHIDPERAVNLICLLITQAQ